jgi:MFS family permease
MTGRDVAALFLRWVWVRAVFHRGWWLVTSLYLVTVADLSPFQLVFLGTAQGITALVFEVPTGVMADTISRKWSIVVAHFVMGTGMLATGLVTAFPALVLTQMVWGLAWTFSSGADVAWLTDELDQPDRVAGVLTASARREQVGAACGLLGFGALAWAISLSTAIVAAGACMLVLGLAVAVLFTEHNFTPTRQHRWKESVSIFRRGVGLARRDHEILLVLATTVLINGAAEGFGRLFARRLVDLGLPAQLDPVTWLTVLGLVTLTLSALALRIIETRIDGDGVARSGYAAACFIGALGALVLALAPNAAIGMAGVLIVQGIAWPVARCVSVIWVNRRVTSDIRATMQSFLAQAEYAGEIVLGVMLGILAQATSITAAMIGSCVLVAYAGVLVVRSRAGRAPGAELEPSRWAGDDRIP